MREHFVWAGDTFVPAHLFHAQKARAAKKHRSLLPAPAFISDDLGPNGLLNHADNKVYTSKAEYVRAVRRAGCEIVGNEKLKRPTHQRPKLTYAERREIREKLRAIDSPNRPSRPTKDYFGGSREAMRKKVK